MTPRKTSQAPRQSSKMWVTYSEEVISACLNGLAETVIDSAEVSSLHIEPGLRQAFDAIQEIKSQGKEITPYNIEEISYSLVKAADMYRIANINFKDAAVASDAVKKQSYKEEVISTAMEMLENIDDMEPEAVIETAVERLSKPIGATKQMSTSEIMREVRKRKPEDIIIMPTNLEWFDRVSKGGLRGKRLYVIAANEKSRKTTVARMLCINACRKFTGFDKYGVPTWVPTNVSVLFMAMENDKQISSLDIISFLMGEYLYYSGTGIIQVKSGKQTYTLEDLCDSEYLEEYIAAGKMENGAIHKEFTKAYEYANKINDSIDFKIVDVSDGLHNLSALKAHVNRFKNATKGRKRIVVIDYMQLIYSSGDAYKDMREASQWAIQLATKIECAVIAIAQNNRAFQERQARGEADGQVGIAQGTELQNATQHLWTLSVSQEKPSEILLTQLRARRAAMSKEVLTIKVSTGIPLKFGGRNVENGWVQ